MAPDVDVSHDGGRLFSTVEGGETIEAALDEGVAINLLRPESDERSVPLGYIDFANRGFSVTRTTFCNDAETAAEGRAL